MKAERNKLLHEIKTTLIKEKEKELEMVKEMDKMKHDAKMSVRELRRKKFENACVHIEKGKRVTNPQEMYKIINKHLQAQFYQEIEEKLEMFTGEPRKLNKEITLLDDSTVKVVKLT